MATGDPLGVSELRSCRAALKPEPPQLVKLQSHERQKDLPARPVDSAPSAFRSPALRFSMLHDAGQMALAG